MDTYGALSLIPAAVVIITALITRRTFEPLILGVVVGCILISGSGFFWTFLDTMYATLMGSTTVWVCILCMCIGSMIVLIEKARGAEGFSLIATKIVKGRKSALIATWILGIIIFIDDYLNALAVGFAMRKITDQYKIPRELLAFIINSTGATVCVLVPFTSWSAYMIGQMDLSGAVPEGISGTMAYCHTIPFVLYGWVAVLFVPLVCLGVIPLFGNMKKANARAAAGQCLPDSMVKQLGETVEIKADAEVAETTEKTSKPRAINFIIPMLVLAVSTIIWGDILVGSILGVVCCVVMFLPQKLMSVGELFDGVLKGFESMIGVLAIVCVAFMLQGINDTLGLAPYVIDAVAGILSPKLIGVVSFFVVAALAFCTGSFWGVAAIAFPIIIPLTEAMGANVYFGCGAVISGVIFGSQACFFSDAATLTCSSAQIKNSDYARNVLPVIAFPFVIAIIVFLIVGTIIG